MFGMALLIKLLKYQPHVGDSSCAEATGFKHFSACLQGLLPFRKCRGNLEIPSLLSHNKAKTGWHWEHPSSEAAGLSESRAYSHHTPAVGLLCVCFWNSTEIELNRLLGYKPHTSNTRLALHWRTMVFVGFNKNCWAMSCRGLTVFKNVLQSCLHKNQNKRYT